MMLDQLSEAERRALDAWKPMTPPVDFIDRVVTARAMPRRLLIVGLAVACTAAAVVAIVVTRPADSSPVATVIKKAGPLETQHRDAAWQAANVGTKLFVGDAVRTSDHPAELRVANSAKLVMSPYTVLRFGGTAQATKIGVELGAIELTGSGNYGLDIGDLQLTSGTVRIAAAGARHSKLELLLGSAQVATLDGQTLDLVMGNAVDVSMSIGVAVVISLDAGVQPIAFDAPIAPIVSGDITIEVTGKQAELQRAGEPWAPLPPGASVLAAGNRVRLAKGTSATVTTKSGTLALAGGARTWVGDDLSLTVELGSAVVTSHELSTLGVPGGRLELAGTDASPAKVALDVTARETKLAVLGGAMRLLGGNGAELAMKHGEGATLVGTGTIRMTQAIPDYFDVRVAVGETFTLHDPRGRTAVQFAFDGKCSDGGVLEIDQDARFRTPYSSAGKTAANLMVGAGAWSYRLRCVKRGVEGPAVASGRVIVRQDSGNRPLPKLPGVNPIDADGRTYRISYQSEIPTVAFRAGGLGKRFRLHLATAGKEETFDATSSTIQVKGKQLAETTYTYWFDRDGVRDTKVSTLIINFDQTAPQVYIESPIDRRPWADQIEIRGAVLAGWTASIDGVTIPVDPHRRFRAKVPPPAGGALAIKLTHPQRGVHYYLRRKS